MIVIVDYGLGNISAFKNAFKSCGIQSRSATTPADLEGATKLILPGVGAFDHAMQLFQDSGMRETVEDLVIRWDVPVLGVCVGMQILAKASAEGTRQGLGWIQGTVRRVEFDDTGRLPLPHMGWNTVTTSKASPLFTGIANDSEFYFLHSFCLHCEDLNDATAMVNYGREFVCAVQHRNVYGVQFHPEKSHHDGLRVLRNFAELQACCA